MISKPDISPAFTIEDIHKIREYNHEITKDMSFEERRVYYRDGAEEAMRQIEVMRKNNRPSA